MQQNEQASSVDVTAPLNDEAMNQYFESGGEVAAEAETTAQESSAAQSQETKENTETAPKQEKVVPHGALHEERMRRKEEQQKTRQLEEKIQRMENTFQHVLQRQVQVQTPTFDQDPLEALRHETLTLRNAVTQQQNFQQQLNAQQAQQQHFQNFVHQYHQSAAAYAKETPDFKEAYHHLVQSKLNEFVTAGYTKEQANQLLMEDEAAVVAKAYQDEVNPAERIYALAKAVGYKAKAQEGVPDLAKIEKGMKASKSLSGGGKTSKDALTLESLSQMSADELDEVLSKDWDKIMKLG